MPNLNRKRDKLKKKICELITKWPVVFHDEFKILAIQYCFIFIYVYTMYFHFKLLVIISKFSINSYKSFKVLK